eukprot:Opistho-2@52840
MATSRRPSQAEDPTLLTEEELRAERLEADANRRASNVRASFNPLSREASLDDPGASSTGVEQSVSALDAHKASVHHDAPTDLQRIPLTTVCTYGELEPIAESTVQPISTGNLHVPLQQHAQSHLPPSPSLTSRMYAIVLKEEVVENKESIARDSFAYQSSTISWLGSSISLLLGSALLGYNQERTFALTLASVGGCMVVVSLGLYYYHMWELARNKPILSRVTVGTLLSSVTISIIAITTASYFNAPT